MVVGRSGSTVARIVRHNSDGSLDTSFGDGGIVTADLGQDDPTLSSLTAAQFVAIQPDGRLLVAGTFTEEFSPPVSFASRYHPDSSVDRTFGEDGLVMPQPIDGRWPAVGETVDGLLLRPDGSIVIAGRAVPARRVVVRRLDGTGAPDSTFGDSGVATIGVLHDGLEVDAVTGAVEQSTGKLVVGCSCSGELFLAGSGIGAFRLGTLPGLVPELTVPLGTTNGVTLDVSNHDPAFTWSVESTAGMVVIDAVGTISVTGLAPGQDVEILVTASRPRYEAAAASANRTALSEELPATGTTIEFTASVARALVAVGATLVVVARRRITRSSSCE